MLVVAGSATAAGGTNLAWNDCVGGGGVPDRTVACTNTGTGTMFPSFVPDQDIPAMAASDWFIDVDPASGTVGSWWNSTPIGTRWGSAVTEPSSGACPGWWQTAPNGPIVFPPPAFLFGSKLRVRLSAVIAAGEEQLVAAGTEWHAGALILKNSAGTAGNAECTAGATIGVVNFIILQPGRSDIHMRQQAQVSNCVTFQNPPNRHCPGATPTQRSTWGSIKALYR